MKNLQISLIELPATTDGTLYGEISNDVYSLVVLPSRATEQLAAIATSAGFENVRTFNPLFSPVRGRLSYEEMKYIVTSDVVGISSITRTAEQSFELADLIKKSNPGAIIVMGGPHVSAFPEEALAHCDIVAMNEADATFVEILNAINDKDSWKKIQGISYNDKGNCERTEKRPFLSNEDLAKIPFPVYPKQVLDRITHAVIITSRGCPYACDYCSVIENFGRKYRFLPVERTIEHIKHTLSQGRKRIFFGDDNFAANPTRTKELMEKIISTGLKIPHWLAQVRVESANDKELLSLMKRAGCERVCIGFESADEKMLKLLNKQATVEKNTLAIKRFHEAKISIHGMFIAGADTDTGSSIANTVEYARKNRIDTVQFLFMVPLPGTKLTKKLEEEKRIISSAWHRYDGHHVLVRPKLMSSVELHEAVNQAWQKFYSINEAFKHLFYGNEHWFNFMVRIIGKKLVKKIVRNGFYYRRALDSLESWYQQAGQEYNNWTAKMDVLSKDMRLSYDEKRERARIELEKALASIRAKRDSLDDLFASHKEALLKELERMMMARLATFVPA